MKKFNSLTELKQYKAELKASRQNLQTDFVENDLSIFNIAQTVIGSALIPKIIGRITGKNKKNNNKINYTEQALGALNSDYIKQQSKPLVARIGKTVAIAALKIIAVNLVIWGAKKANQKLKERKLIRQVQKRKEELINKTLSRAT